MNEKILNEISFKEHYNNYSLAENQKNVRRVKEGIRKEQKRKQMEINLF